MNAGLLEADRKAGRGLIRCKRSGKRALLAVLAVLVLAHGSTAMASNEYNTQIMADRQQISQVDGDQNKQLSKEAFTKQQVDVETFSGYFMQEQLSDYQVFAGTVIPGLMLTGLNSDLPGQIIGQVSENIYDTTTGKYLLIPQGTKIIGEYDSKVTFGQNRALVVWKRLVFPNGNSILLGNMQGSDREGYSGFKDKVNSHYGRALWSAFAGGAAAGGVAAATIRGHDDDFIAQTGAKTAENISSAVNSITQKNLNIQPTIIIRPGYQFNIIVSKDLVLEPYEDWAQ